MKLEPSETEFQSAVVHLAELAGWRTMHVRRSIARDNRWATTTSITGWPDLVLWRPGQFIAVELKSEKGRLSRQQADVLQSLTAASIDTHVWRPSDWPQIETILTDRNRP